MSCDSFELFRDQITAINVASSSTNRYDRED